MINNLTTGSLKQIEILIKVDSIQHLMNPQVKAFQKNNTLAFPLRSIMNIY